MPSLADVAAVIGAVGACYVPFSIHMHNLKRQEISALQNSLKEANDKIQALQIELPRSYMPKDEMTGIVNRIFDALDDIRKTLNQKADRNEHSVSKD